MKIEISNFASFVTEADKFDTLGNVNLFRGQAVKGNLLPTIARRNPKTNTESCERNAIEQLRLQGAPVLSNRDGNDLDVLIEAQHHGLKTRLLDWTTNPLIALWFACSSRDAGDVFVYVLNADDYLIKNTDDIDPFGIKKTGVLQPRLNNPRVTAQQGWFTLHRYSRSWEQFVSLENNKEMKNLLIEIKICQTARQRCLKSLERFGVNSRTVFPDLTGVCSYLNWKLDM